MNARHTPGPWATTYNNVARLLVIDDERRLIARVWRGQGVTENGQAHGSMPDLPVAEAEANARLLAAAPEMRAWIESVIERFDAAGDPSSDDINQARALLARIDGGKP